MNKDLINRILNVAELTGYILVIYLGELFYNLNYGDYDDAFDCFLGLVFITFLRLCFNYIFQLKYSNMLMLNLFRKIFKK